MNRYEIKKVFDLQFYTEGPAVDGNGNLFVTTLSGGKILRIEATGLATIWAEGDCPNGQAISPSGAHWFCESRNGRIAVYDAYGRFMEAPINGRCAGAPVIAPNDLIFDSKGNLYFTDSARTDGKVFFLGADGTQKLLARGINYANGLALDHREEILYVAESYCNRILVIDLLDSEQALKARKWVDLPQHPSGDPIGNLPDGLAVDREGNVWVAHYGMQALQVISVHGELLYSLDTSLPLTSNLTFVVDNPGYKKILITGGYGEPGPGAVMMAEVFF